MMGNHLGHRRPRNVEHAARARGVSFPTGLDNDYAAWGAYANRYWPSQYVVDGQGHIRYAHLGVDRPEGTLALALALLIIAVGLTASAKCSTDCSTKDPTRRFAFHAHG
jgi:hypothetical protein